MIYAEKMKLDVKSETPKNNYIPIFIVLDFITFTANHI